MLIWSWHFGKKWHKFFCTQLFLTKLQIFKNQFFAKSSVTQLKIKLHKSNVHKKNINLLAYKVYSIQNTQKLNSFGSAPWNLRLILNATPFRFSIIGQFLELSDFFASDFSLAWSLVIIRITALLDFFRLSRKRRGYGRLFTLQNSILKTALLYNLNFVNAIF